MADTQEQLLTEITTLDPTDFVRVVNNPTTTPDSAVMQKSKFVDVLFNDVITPTIASGATENNWAPTGLATAHTVRILPSGPCSISGITTGAIGRIIILHNVGFSTITLLNESGLSTGVNRFSLPNSANVALVPDTMVIIQYDFTDGRWRVTGVGGGSGGREILAADRTYYVRTDGSDSNSGLTNSAAGAFLTVQRAIDVAASLDTSIYNIIIQVVDGTYVSNEIKCKNILGSGSVTIQGNTTTPDNVVIDGGFSKDAPGTIYTVKWLKLIKTTSSFIFAFFAENGAVIFFDKINFSTGFTYHIWSQVFASIRAVTGSTYTVSGNASYHLISTRQGSLTFNTNTVNIIGALTVNWVTCDGISFIYAYLTTFTGGGSVSGTRYSVGSNSVVNTFGGGANYFPGSVAGSTSTGGQYL